MSNYQGDGDSDIARLRRQMPSKANILMVDDRPDKLLALSSILEGLNQNIVIAHSGKDALRLLLKDDFAVILLDVSMPVMDGFETAALIRQRDRTAHTPIIFISAINSTDTHVSKGYSLGAVDYIFAPVVPEILRAKVSVFIELFRKTEQLARNEALFRRIFDEAPIGMALLDEHESFQKVNGTFCHMLGYQADELCSMSYSQTARPDDREREVEETSRMLRGETPVVSLDKRYLDKTGKEVWASVTTIRMRDAEGKEAHRLVMAMDITEKRHIKQLERLTYDLQRTNAELEQFAYIASHDLQEPLRMISAYCTLLDRQYKNRLDKKAQEYLGYATESAVRMHNLIKDLLSFSRAGSQERSFREANCEEVLAIAIDNLKTAISESGAVVTHHGLPTVLGDPGLLTQLFQNLIGNAIKFRRDVEPRITVTAHRREAAWEFEVADNGIGIDATHFGKIFGIFQRLHSRQDYPGTGIGLALCRKVIDCHGGRIWVESTPGAGSTFRFTIPHEQRSTATPTPAEGLVALRRTEAVEHQKTG